MARTIEEVREAKRLHMAQKRLKDPEGMRKYQRENYHRNREARKATMRAYYAEHFFWGRAMKLRGHGRATAADLESIWETQKGLCAMTGRVLDQKTAQLDHIMPKARGGGDEPANLRWVCQEANLMKRDMTDAELLAICQDFMRWIGERIEARR